MKTPLAYIVISRRTENGSLEVQHNYSSIAQLAEHSTVNRRVTGSSPVGGAVFKAPHTGENAGERGLFVFVTLLHVAKCGHLLARMSSKCRHVSG